MTIHQACVVMPWHQTEPMNERARFVHVYQEKIYSMTELCSRFGISRKTGYKWINRFEKEGLDGLFNRSRAPHNCPHRTPRDIEKRIVESCKSQRYKRGPRKLRRLLQDEHPEANWPPVSTFADIYKRNGLSMQRKPRQARDHLGRGTVDTSIPNAVWTADYKGHVPIDRRRCHPLTIQDSGSRLLIDCRALASTSREEAWPVFEKAFQQFGLPDAIRTDNGVPFVANGWLGLTKMAVWWIKLGIDPQRTRPGRPQDNARHERMHRTLKIHTMMPPSSTFEDQQRRFDDFRDDFNNVRPHQALDDDTPASRYKPSGRVMPDRIKEPTYPDHFEVRKVSGHGTIKFKNNDVFVSQALVGEQIGLEEVDFEIWDIVFYKTSLARYDEKNQRIT